MCNYDYSKLSGRIVEVCGTQMKFAEQINLSQHSVSNKLNGKKTFRQDEIERCIKVLGLQKSDIPVYFFTEKV